MWEHVWWGIWMCVGIFPQVPIIFLFVFKAESVTKKPRLDGQWTTEFSMLSLPPQHWDYYATMLDFLHVDCWDWNQVLKQHYPLSYFLGPRISTLTLFEAQKKIAIPDLEGLFQRSLSVVHYNPSKNYLFYGISSKSQEVMVGSFTEHPFWELTAHI